MSARDPDEAERRERVERRRHDRRRAKARARFLRRTGRYLARRYGPERLKNVS